MDASLKRVFYHHADASPLGGVLSHPKPIVIPSLASSSLSPAGGHGSSRACPFRLDGILSCDHAYSEVEGIEVAEGGPWTTSAIAVVEGFNVKDVVTADRIVAKLEVQYPAVGHRPTVSLLGSRFENLRIENVPVNPVLDAKLIAGSTEAGFVKEAPAKRPNFVSKATANLGKINGAKGLPDWLGARYGWIGSEQDRTDKGHVVCSLVDRVKVTAPVKSYGHVIVVPDFGNVFLGELVVDHNSFHLTMLRIELGCAHKGKIGAASARSNGAGIP